MCKATFTADNKDPLMQAAVGKVSQMLDTRNLPTTRRPVQLNRGGAVPTGEPVQRAQPANPQVSNVAADIPQTASPVQTTSTPSVVPPVQTELATPVQLGTPVTVKTANMTMTDPSRLQVMYNMGLTGSPEQRRTAMELLQYAGLTSKNPQEALAAQSLFTDLANKPTVVQR